MSIIGVLLRGFGGTVTTTPEVGETTNQLTHSPADIVRWTLIDLTVGTDPSTGAAWPIFCDGEGDTPDNAITVYNTSGIVEGEVHYNGEVQEHYGIQFRVRATKPTVAWPKINELMLACDQQVNNNIITVDGTQYYVECITRKGTVLALGKESPTSKRFVYTLNATVSLRQIV